MLALLLLVGCSQPKIDEPVASESSLFGPTAMRIHPIFTQMKDWTGDGKPDGFEVLLEFQDQFGDPTKACGTVMFELFDYRQGNPEPRGARLVNPWIGPMASSQDQIARWNRTSRTYTFQLSYPQLSPDKTYVLTAMFRSSTGGRFFDRVVIEGQEAPVGPTSRPTTPSNTQPTTQP
ncbi:MAG: hypothetical protein ACM359_11625 [Bacillota bacterium]